MNKNTTITIVVIIALILVGGLIYAMTMSSEDTTAIPNTTTSPSSDTTNSPAAGTSTGEVKSFTVTSSSFKFSPTEIRVKEGDRVKVTLNNTNGFHDFVVDEFNARTRQINGAGTDTVEFVANKKGTFEYYCSVGNHRQMGMVGKIVVE